jgi:hypothetical protein
MIPPVTHPVWAQVITGKREVPPSKVAVNMLVANVRLSYKQDPTDENLRKLSTNMVEFFQKYQNLYQAELDQILQSGAHA